MTNPKGTKFETLVVGYLNAAEMHAERTGSELRDEADIHFGAVKDDGEWTIEAKDHLAIDIPAYLRQLEASIARRSAVPFKAAAVVKHRQKGVAESYAVMRLERFRQLAAYVIILEQMVADGTGVTLPYPGQLKDFLGYLAAKQANMAELYGEFAGPEEVEVQQDGTEVPAGQSTGCSGCGKVHTQEDYDAAMAFLSALFADPDGGREEAEADAEEADAAPAGGVPPLAEWEAELLADPEMAEAAEVAADMDAIEAAMRGDA